MQEPSKQKATLANSVFIIIIIVFAAAIVVIGYFRPQGAVAQVSVADGESQRIALNKDGVYAIEGGALPVELEVKEGKIRFINSVCPDHVCEGFGWLSKEEDKAVCAPARVVVSIEE